MLGAEALTDKIRMGALSGRRLLVAEDRYLLASDLEALLSTYGAQVLGPCATLSEALSLAAQADGALLDVDLGGEQVFPVAEQLRARNCAVVFVTGHGVEQRPAAWARSPWLQKPCDPYEAVAALAQALDGTNASG